MASQQNLTIFQGADWDVTVTWSNAGTPHNVTGATGVLTVDDQAKSVTLLTVTSGLTFGGTAGTITWNVPASVTATLPAVIARYDLFVTLAGGVREKVLYGQVDVQAALPTITGP